GALKLLEDLRAKVEAAGLDPAYREQLLVRVDMHIGETRRFIEQNQPRIELAERNQRTRDEIEREEKLEREIEQKIAFLVDDFNRKVDEQRY
ncbi:MAG: hypothetical protein GTN78_00255, partial [Gemmatimonadales bacterium]|nr:hypothetical protein [Gemmatimonadales bacterium]